MLERLWVKQERKRHFAACFFLSFAFTLLSIFVTDYFVKFQIQNQELSGFISVLLASLAASYPLIRYLERREKEEEKIEDIKEVNLLERHWTELKIYLSFFLGSTFAFGVSNSFMPEDFFAAQKIVIGSITGKIISMGLFSEIITNNVSLFFLTFLLSFLLTAGMVFILVWNASVLGVFLSNVSKSFLHLPVVALSYLPHGILEIASYILAGISGFFLSHELKELGESKDKDEVLNLVKGSLFLLVVGLIFLALAGVMESLAI